MSDKPENEAGADPRAHVPRMTVVPRTGGSVVVEPETAPAPELSEESSDAASK